MASDCKRVFYSGCDNNRVSSSFRMFLSRRTLAVVNRIDFKSHPRLSLSNLVSLSVTLIFLSLAIKTSKCVWRTKICICTKIFKQKTKSQLELLREYHNACPLGYHSWVYSDALVDPLLDGDWPPAMGSRRFSLAPSGPAKHLSLLILREYSA